MTYDTYRLIFIIGAALAGVMFALAVVLFFVLKIPRVIGDLTGANARKAIENMRNQNTETGDKVHKTSAVNKARGQVTSKMTPSGRLDRKQHTTAGAMETEKLGTQRLNAEAAASVAAGVELPQQAAPETTLLAPNYSETTLLAPEMYPAAPPEETSPFRIEYELTFVHSDELIA